MCASEKYTHTRPYCTGSKIGGHPVKDFKKNSMFVFHLDSSVCKHVGFTKWRNEMKRAACDGRSVGN